MGKSAVVEVYPSLWKHAFPADDRTPGQHDAFCVASWLSKADRSGQLERFLQPNLTLPERMVAGVEGFDPRRRVIQTDTYRPRYTAVICSLSCPSSALIVSRTSQSSSRCSAVRSLDLGPPTAGAAHPVSSR